MIPNDPRPLLGAAMPVAALETYRDWIVGDQRDLEIQDFCFAELLEGDWRPVAAKAKEHLKGYSGRLGIHGPFWGFGIASMDPDVRKIAGKRMMQGLDACEEIGATQMVIHSPYTTWDYNNIDFYPDGRSRVIANAHATLGEAVKRAEALGVTLVIENIEDKNPADRAALAASFGSEAVKLSVDTGHAHYAHGSTGAPPVDAYILAAGSMLHHVHIQDTDGYADRHWPPGRGTILWPSIFEALARIDAKPRLNIEVRDKAEIPKAADWLSAQGLAR